MLLSKVERSILMGQREIICLLSKKSVDDDFYYQALLHGYAADYFSLVNTLPDECSPEICREVRAILDLYVRLAQNAARFWGLQILSFKADFPGFDAASESNHYRYAIHLAAHGYFGQRQSLIRNSARSLLVQYREMLTIAASVDPSREMTLQEVRVLLEIAPEPIV